MATSSRTMEKSVARCRSASHTAWLTSSRFVSSDSALYCATTALTTSLPMDGSTRSSQSVPRFCTAALAVCFIFAGGGMCRRGVPAT